MKNHDPAEQSRNQQAAADPKPEAHKPMGAPDRDAAIHALIEALECPERDGPFQAALDRAKAAMKGG